ncbi:REJ domain-containing protein [Candidatus Poriferisocius sp.]|uniref:REJ domain-containing protein n=1 Tax=Candidatus Poriferisocius sp. TaxID=3101276 RepID=UPI003B5C89BB
MTTDADTGVQTGTLNGGNSFDPDDDDHSNPQLTYKWEVVTDAYSWLELSGRTTTTATFTVPSAALAARYGLSIDFRLTVTDDEDVSASAEVTFNLNQTPTADISVSANLEDEDSTETGVDRYTVDAVIDGPGENGNADNEWDIREGALLVLDGSGSSDANGRVASYAWSRLYVTNTASTYGLPAESGSGPTHSTDDANTAETVETLDNLPADDSPDSPYYAYYTLTVTDNAQPASESQPAVVKLVIHDQPATPEVKLVASTDADGSLQESTFPSDTPRWIASPGTTITLDASGTTDADDPSGGPTTITNYAWTGAKQDSTTATTATLKVDDDAEDGTVLTVSVAATDSSGLTGTASIEFLVVDGNNRPRANTGSDDVTTPDGALGGDKDANNNPTGRITFRGIGFDEDQSASSLIYAWAELGSDGKPVDPDDAVLELEGASTDTVSFAVPEIGKDAADNKPVTLSFTVADQYGVAATDTVTVTIEATDANPVADAGPDVVVPAGDFVRLNGAGSADPDKGDSIAYYEWELTDISTSPSTTEVLKSVADKVRDDVEDFLEASLPATTDDDYPIGFLTGANTAYPYFDAPKVASGIAAIHLTFTLTVQDGRMSAANEDKDTVVITVDSGFYWPPITGPNFCTNVSLGGPRTYAFDSNGDGRADTCSLRTTRRATVARQNALYTLVALDSTIEVDGLDASENPAESHASFEDLVVGRDGVDADTSTDPDTPAVASVDGTCKSAPKNLGDSEADLAADACETGNVSDPPPPVDPAKAAEFFSGTITGPDYCTNLSLGGPRTYAFDSDGDGVGDVCSLPYTRREAVARQNALEMMDKHPQYASALASACAALGSTDFGDGEAALAKDECNPDVAQPALGGPLVPAPTS